MKRILILFLLFINCIKCVDYQWASTDVGSYMFEDSINWSPQNVPGALDTATVTNGGYVVSLSSISISSLEVFYGTFAFASGTLMAFNYIYISTLLAKFYLAGGGTLQSPNIYVKGALECIKVEGNTQVFDCYIVFSNLIVSDYGQVSVDQNCSLSLYEDYIQLSNYSTISLKEDSHMALLGVGEAKGINMFGNSSITNLEGGTFHFNNTVYALDYSYIMVYYSQIQIFNYMAFFNNASLSIEYLSTLISNDSFIAYDSSFLIIENYSYAMFSGFAAFYNTSMLWVAESSIIWVNGQLYGAVNSILSVWSGSYIYVRGPTVFGNVINNNATIIIENTCYINNILSNQNANFSVTGVFHFNALYGYFDNSRINNQGDFNLNGIIYANKTVIDISKGNFNVNDGAYLWLFDCSVMVDGIVSISNTSFLNIEGTVFYVSEKGEMESKGNIYLNQHTDFNNVGTLNIHSGIYYTNDTSIKSTNVSVSNSGTFNVLEKIDINVGFNNTGNINLNNNQLFIYDLNQLNGTISLSGGAINSDNSFKINGGTIEGSGVFNNSIIQTSGTIGSKNTVNNIKVNGSLKSSVSSKMVFLVDSLNSFSSLDVLQDVDFTGEIEVRISIEFLEDLKSGKFESGSLNINNLESSLSSSSSSSSSVAKINLVNYNSNSKNSFNSIKFKTYDPKDNSQEDKDYDGCNVSTSKSDKSFSLLFNQNDCQGGSNITSKISGGVIAAIVICVAFAVIVVSVAFHYRERLRLLKKSSKVGTKLKSVRNSIRNSVSLKSTNNNK